MHTNYTELAIRTGGFGVGYLMCGLMHSINWCLCGMHTHRVRSGRLHRDMLVQSASSTAAARCLQARLLGHGVSWLCNAEQACSQLSRLRWTCFCACIFPCLLLPAGQQLMCACPADYQAVRRSAAPAARGGRERARRGASLSGHARRCVRHPGLLHAALLQSLCSSCSPAESQKLGLPVSRPQLLLQRAWQATHLQLTPALT